MSQASERRVLVTGANGFVGRHLCATLRQDFGAALVLSATSRSQDIEPGSIGGPVDVLDVTDKAAVAEMIRRFQPTHVINLAGLASVNAANANPAAAWQIHLFGALNIADALLVHAPRGVLISVGTGLVYGASARTVLALDEATLLVPTNGYEVTKAAGDLALGALVGKGLRCIRMRPFNHIGPGQTEDFVVASFAMQIARIEAGLQPPVLRVGNLDAERDFLDVRDVTAAYSLAVAKSDGIASGTILNIASGQPCRIRDLLDRLLAQSTTAITVELDPTRLRPSDTPRYVGDAGLARRLLGWSPRYPLDVTLAAVLGDCRVRVRTSLVASG